MTQIRVPYTGLLLPGTQMIPLTRGQYSLIDEDNFDEYMQWNWQAYWNQHTKSFYAVRKVRGDDGKQHHERMHQRVMGFQWAQVDHINHGTLDNRRENLRNGTLHNSKNGSLRGGTSQYHGVYWDKQHQKWAAQIWVDGKSKYLGYFDDEIEAVRAYDVASGLYHGEYGTRNFL